MELIAPFFNFYYFPCKNKTALGCVFFKKSNRLIRNDVRWLQFIDDNLFDSVEKTEGWKETESGFVPALKTREAGLQVI